MGGIGSPGCCTSWAPNISRWREGKRLTYKYSLSEFRIFINGSILLARGLLVVLIHLPCHVIFVRLNHTLLPGKLRNDRQSDIRMTAYHNFSTHEGLVEVA